MIFLKKKNLMINQMGLIDSNSTGLVIINLEWHWLHGKKKKHY
jgi:hypothetical protein